MGIGKGAIWAEMQERAGAGRPSPEHPHGTGDAAGRIVGALEGFLGG